LSPQQVRSRFFQVHLYVLLGLHTLAAALAGLAPEQFPLWPPLAGAVLCYAASVMWPHQNPRWGRASLVAIAVVSLAAALLAAPQTSRPESSAQPPSLLHHDAFPATAIELFA